MDNGEQGAGRSSYLSDALHSKEWLRAWIVGALTLLYAVWMIVRRRQAEAARRQREEQRSGIAAADEAQTADACSDPMCVRCRNYRALTDNAMERLDSVDPSNVLTRLRTAVMEMDKTKGPSVPESAKKKQQVPTVLYVDGLRAKPFWDADDAVFAQVRAVLEDRATFEDIQSECMGNLYKYEKETSWRGNPVSQGAWNVLHLVNQGVVQERVRELCPKTFAALQHISSFADHCVFGNAFFSVVYPGSHIAAHCGPTNTRLRCHLALSVPLDGTCAMTVGGAQGGWTEGQCVFFDDSFEHSVDVFDDCRDERVALVVDLWHPDLTADERTALEAVFRIGAGFKEEKL